MRRGHVVASAQEYACYSTSAAPGQSTAAQWLQSIRDHWAASENGAHYRRDVSLGEDASQISGRPGAFVMASLRNLVLGLFELQKHRGHTQAHSFPGWRRRLTDSQKIQLLTQTP